MIGYNNTIDQNKTLIIGINNTISQIRDTPTQTFNHIDNCW